MRKLTLTGFGLVTLLTACTTLHEEVDVDVKVLTLEDRNGNQGYARNLPVKSLDVILKLKDGVTFNLDFAKGKRFNTGATGGFNLVAPLSLSYERYDGLSCYEYCIEETTEEDCLYEYEVPVSCEETTYCSAVAEDCEEVYTTVRPRLTDVLSAKGQISYTAMGYDQVALSSEIYTSTRRQEFAEEDLIVDTLFVDLNFQTILPFDYDASVRRSALRSDKPLFYTGMKRTKIAEKTKNGKKVSVIDQIKDLEKSGKLKKGSLKRYTDQKSKVKKMQAKK
jgi:hypothetical protein